MISGMTVTMYRSAKLHKGKKIHSNYGINNTYSDLSDIFIRKMMKDLDFEKIADVSDFRRFNRAIGAIADYLDYKMLKCDHGFFLSDVRGCAECDLEAYQDGLSELDRDERLDKGGGVYSNEL
jgi:hypothetical protein